MLAGGSVIRLLVWHRWRRGLRALLGAGVALGLALGLAMAGFASARHTATSYGRVLDAADAETASVAHSTLSPAEAAAILDAQPLIARHQYQGGFIAYIEGKDPALVGASLASADDGFAIELPTLEAGRLPDPARADEVFINSVLAETAGLAVGDELNFVVRSFDGADTTVPATVVGVGTLPREAVADDTVLNGIVVFTRAFYEANEARRVYANSRIWLDDPQDLPALAPVLSAQGVEISETRAQEREGVEDALRPTVTVLIAVGLLASLATVVIAVQVVQRRQDQWRLDDLVLNGMGADRRSRVLVHLIAIAADVAVAAIVAIAVMLVASPRAPIGPLHDLDPAQGVHLDLTIAVAGVAVLAVVLAIVTLALSLGGGSSARASAGPSKLMAAAQRPSSLAGLSLAVRSRRRTGARLTIVAAAGGLLLAGVATLAVSARALVDTPRHYGVDFDVLAINAYGDQVPADVERAFSGPEVTDAASFTSYILLVDGHTVPGLGITKVKGDAGPTLLEGDSVAATDEVVLGVETAELIGVGVGDQVAVQAAVAFGGGPPPPPRTLRVAGIATFAAISQQGTDEARLGVGALVDRATLEALGGSAANFPEWTVAAMADGTSAQELIAANPAGIEDLNGIPTRWFTQARPAEVVQLHAAAPVLAGAVAVAFLLLVALLVQGTWSRTRGSRTELAILRALGFSRRQLARSAAWQAVPPGLAALVVGIPLGIVVGRLGFRAFAGSIAVVDEPSSPVWLVAVLIIVVLAAAATAAAVAGSVAAKVPSIATLRAAERRT